MCLLFREITIRLLLILLSLISFICSCCYLVALSCLFLTPWMAACQGPLSSTISQSLLKFMSIELVMLSNHFILCHPLLLLPSIFPSIRVYSNGSPLPIRQKYCSGLLFPSLGDLLKTEIKPVSLAFASRCFTTEPTGKP